MVYLLSQRLMEPQFTSVSPIFCFASTGFISYLSGSFPTGYLAGRMRGVDIRTVGSGNVGATNVTRHLGKGFGYPVFVIDFLKGLVPVLLARIIAQRCQLDSSQSDLCVALAGILSVIGHSYPV